MNKKLNTVLFILGATLFNMLVTVLSFFLLLLLYAKTIMPILPVEANMWSFPGIFVASLAIAFLVYRYVLRYLIKKINMEQYFDPLFVRQQKNKVQQE